MNLLEIFTIIILHFFADFYLQREKDALNKYKDITALYNHVLGYHMIWYVPALIYWFTYSSIYIMFFPSITFILHFITDYFTSKVTHKAFVEKNYYGKYNSFWTIVAFDQVLHLVQLFGLYQIFKQW